MALISLLPLSVLGAVPSAAQPPALRVAIVANSVDRPAGEELLNALRAGGANPELLRPDELNVSEFDVIVVLGGPDAYEGVGNLTSTIIDQDAAHFVRHIVNSSIIYNGLLNGTDAVVVAGITRRETALAAKVFIAEGFANTKLYVYGTFEATGYRPGQFAVYNVTVELVNGTVINGTITSRVLEGEIGGVRGMMREDSMLFPSLGERGNLTFRWLQLENGSICTQALLPNSMGGPRDFNCTPLWAGRERPPTYGLLYKMVAEVRSVPAGEFLALRILTATTMKWVAPEVPLGGVIELSQILSDGSMQTLTLLSYGG